MNDERRRLLLARETWRSMHPSQAEVLRAAKRIASKFPPPRIMSWGRRVRMVSGALATIAGIAYAGSGGWPELVGRFGRERSGRPLSEEQALATESRRMGPRDAPTNRIGVVPEHLAVAEPTAPATESTAKAKKKGARTAAALVRRAARTMDGKEPAPFADRVDPTWADVNAALGALDYTRAESLLLQLTDTRHDADTRAKAHLGLAQLAAARGDCDRARVLSLGVAAATGIEMKTVRRALELAVRCAK